METLGQTPGSVLLSIGVCGFGPERRHGRMFYERISVASCLDIGLKIDADTLLWWMRQSDEARAELQKQAKPLAEVLVAFNEFVGADADCVEVWGNGASFDLAVLATAYKACRLPVPWKFWNERCYRTMKALYPEIRMERTGTHHNALDDALSQARHLAQILMHISKGGNPVMEGGAS